MRKPVRYVKPNMTNLRGRWGKDIINQIRNSPHADLSRLKEGAERCRAQLLVMREKEMGRRDE